MDELKGLYGRLKGQGSNSSGEVKQNETENKGQNLTKAPDDISHGDDVLKQTSNFKTSNTQKIQQKYNKARDDMKARDSVSWGIFQPIAFGLLKWKANRGEKAFQEAIKEYSKETNTSFDAANTQLFNNYMKESEIRGSTESKKAPDKKTETESQRTERMAKEKTLDVKSGRLINEVKDFLREPKRNQRMVSGERKLLNVNRALTELEKYTTSRERDENPELYMKKLTKKIENLGDLYNSARLAEGLHKYLG